MTRKQMAEYHTRCLPGAFGSDVARNQERIKWQLHGSSSVKSSWCLQEKWALEKHPAPRAGTVLPSLPMGMRGKADNWVSSSLPMCCCGKAGKSVPERG